MVELRRIGVGILGCGFLGSWVALGLAPLARMYVLVDREAVGPENYDSSVYLRGQVGRSKSLALAATLAQLTTAEIHVWRGEVRGAGDMDRVYSAHPFDLAVLAFDNVESRLVVREWALRTGVPVIWAGVTANYGLVTWADQVSVPEDLKTPGTKPCSRVEMRHLGMMTAGLVVRAVMEWLGSGERNTYTVSLGRGGVSVSGRGFAGSEGLGNR